MAENTFTVGQTVKELGENGRVGVVIDVVQGASYVQFDGMNHGVYTSNKKLVPVVSEPVRTAELLKDFDDESDITPADYAAAAAMGETAANIFGDESEPETALSRARLVGAGLLEEDSYGALRLTARGQAYAIAQGWIETPASEPETQPEAESEAEPDARFQQLIDNALPFSDAIYVYGATLDFVEATQIKAAHKKELQTLRAENAALRAQLDAAQRALEMSTKMLVDYAQRGVLSRSDENEIYMQQATNEAALQVKNAALEKLSK